MPTQRERKGNFFPLLLLVLFLFAAIFLARDSSKPIKVLRHEIDELPLATIDDWKKEYPEIKAFTYETEAVTLPANLKHPGIQTQEFFQFPEEGYGIGYKPEIVNGPNNLLHHVDVFDSSARTLFCKGKSLNVIMSSGKEMPSGVMPLGYATEATRSFKQVFIMYHNTSPVIYKNVKMKLTFWYIPKGKKHPLIVQPFYLDVLKPCSGGGNYYVNPRSSSTVKTNPSYEIERSGKIVLIGAHVHDFAENIEVVLNNEDVKKFTVKKNKNGEISPLPVSYPKDLYVKKGDRLQVQATYKNTSDKKIEAMGLMLFYLLPK